MAANHGPFIWYEYASNDTAAAGDFYGHVIPWTVSDSGMPGMDYTLLSAPDGMVAGLVKKSEGAPSGWLGYVAVADVDETVAAFGQHGGATLVPAMDIPEIGRMAVVTDPDGAAIAIMKPSSPETWTADLMNRPGHCGWHELYAGDGVKAFEFYSSVFGWQKGETMDMGAMGVYQIFTQDGHQIGGIMTKPQEMPSPQWNFYFHVEAVDAATARAEERGAIRIMGPHQVPGGSWVVQVLDREKAMVSLISAVR